jgi:tRNA pseudouridine38-40 synthase
MRNIKLVIEYDGTGYNRCQKQKDQRTIQQEIENALEKILKNKMHLIGSGRTDSGVHALGQVANFKTDSNILPNELLMALNAMLPQDIVIVDASYEKEDFNSRISAKKKHYRYVINNSKLPSALNKDREYHYKYYLDVDNMKLAAKDLIGKHDFRAFMAAGSKVVDTKREMYDIKINTLNGRIIIDVIGNGFLYNMVRIIVGTLLDIGSGRLDICTIKNMLLTGDRNLGGKTVPPQGLYLVNVEYEN